MGNDMNVKVCGITSFEQLVELQNIGADYAGLIFYEGSKRFAGTELANQKEAVAALEIPKVGVFVNAPEAVIEQAIRDYGLSAVQFHGDETPDFCGHFMGSVGVIKAFRIDDETDIDALVTPYNDCCNYYLLDTASETYGGSGQQFDWNKLEKAVVSKLFFLSGGIGPGDANRVAGFYHSFLYGVDINSRFEVSPGTKDLKKVEAFISHIKDSGKYSGE
jgi:phosphoribosylanthranilate isomerase